MTITQIISSITDKVRNLKVNRYGGYDPIIPDEYAPYGCDCNPIEKTLAIYAPTTSTAPGAVIGYQNTQQLAAPGENRQYATDATGTFKFNVWQRADGTVLIGDSDSPSAYVNHMAQYEAMDAALQAQVTSINGQLTAIASAINAIAPGSYTPTFIALDTTAAKLIKIKVQ